MPLVYFLPAFLGGMVLSPDDALLFNTPLRVMWADMLRSGSLPLWNPYIFGGMPLLGAAQGGVLFPLNWFYILLPPAIAVNLTVLSTYSLASLGAFLYARRSGAPLSGAFATSLVWTFCGFMVAHIGHPNAIQVAALLPWLLWALDGFGAKGGRGRGALVAVVVALQVFAGHQQTLVYALLLAGAYTLVMGRTAAGAARSRYLGSLAFMAVGLLLAAVQILPTAELMRNSLRASASYEFFSSFSLPPVFVGALLAPYVVGGGDGRLFAAPYIGEPFYGEYIGYVGIAALALAALALRFVPDARTKFWAATLALALALALGRYLPFDLYNIVYHIPVINLFRVPARHLMEFDFALAVLAGRGVVAFVGAPATRVKILQRWTISTGIVLFLLTVAVVTVWRPDDFRLFRDAPATFLRAPELFMPPVIVLLSAWALWLSARKGHRRSLLILLGVLTLDLWLWGHSSGWAASSPRTGDAYWNEPVSLKLIRGATGGEEPFRILTVAQPIDPNTGEQGESQVNESFHALIPNIYMMHGVQNAAGYDGFGLARYGALAGNMKLWGDLESPREILSGDSRSLDLLNVRFLFVKKVTREALERVDRKADSPSIVNIGGNFFAAQDLSVPELNGGDRLSFDVRRTRAKRFAIVSNLSWSPEVKHGTTIARVRLLAEGGREFVFDVRAGEHTAEWAFDRSDIKARIRHRRPPLATSYSVEDAQAGDYEAHSYLAWFDLPERAVIIGGEIEIPSIDDAPSLGFKLLRATLMDVEPEDTVPIRNEWFSNRRRADDEREANASRWRRVGDYGPLEVYENTRTLPRAWLASSTLALSDSQTLDVIRTGVLPDGGVWEPHRTALLEKSLDLNFSGELGDDATATVMEYGPNRLTVKTRASSPSLLVVSENHYPGWRAYLDGRRVEMLRANYNLRGVALPAGEHAVEFVYGPGSVLIGLLLSLVTAAALLYWALRSRVAGSSP